MRNSLKIAFAESIKSIKIFLCYPAELAGFAVFPLLWVVPLIFQGKAMAGGIRSISFGALSGTDLYLPFIMIGAIVSTYVFSSLYGTGASLREEAYYGTLEALLASPADRYAILLGKALCDTFLSTVMVAGQAALCMLVFRFGLTLPQILMVFCVVLLMVTGLYGLGIALAGIGLIIKETRGLTHTLNSLMFLLSPLRYPVEISSLTRILSLILPLTHALVMLRGIVLMGKSINTLWPEIGILAVLDLVCVAGGLWIFTKVETMTKKSGVVGHY